MPQPLDAGSVVRWGLHPPTQRQTVLPLYRSAPCASAHAEGSTGDDANLPAGANLTIECIENIVARNSGSIFIRLSDPSRLEMAVEVPAAPLERALLPELDEALPSFEEVELPEQVAPGIL